uniref:Uncharacterized protein MANES_09G126200 n=1 Tax=Rhizophora mucronata TaxID=61149 RepID=A0A2P2MX19_RHIMU
MAGGAATRSLLMVLGLLLVAPLTLGRPLDGVINRVNLQAADYIGIVVTSAKVESLLNEDFTPSEYISEVDLAGRTFRIGTLEGANVIIVNTGSYPVNVATGVQALIDNFPPLRGIVSVGNAGSTNENELEIGDVSVSEQVAYTGNWKWQPYEATGGDLTFGTYNAPKSGKNLLGSILYQKTKFYTPRGSSPDVLNIPVTSNWLQIASQLKNTELQKCLGTSASNCLPKSPKVRYATKTSSSEIYVSNLAYRQFIRNEFDASSVDRSSSAVALACWSNGVEFTVLRGISNYAGGSGSNSAFGELGAINVVKAAKAFLVILNRPRLAFAY